MIPEGWKLSRFKAGEFVGIMMTTPTQGVVRFYEGVHGHRAIYKFLDALLRQTESEAPKPRKARGVISYAERERYTLDDADEEVQSLMDRDMGASG